MNDAPPARPNRPPTDPSPERSSERSSEPSQTPSRDPSQGPSDTLTHFDAEGRAHMVDVGDKAETHRVAVAEGCIRMLPATLAMIEAGTHEKGDVLGIARVAGIMASKRTSELVPLCHPIGLTRVVVDFETEHADAPLVRCRVRAETRSRTGVEMEALIGLQVALATVYDMCKAVDRGMTMTDLRVLEKRGGKSGDWHV